jgi:hypothetical protein
MSHFIWAQTLAMMIAILTFYFIERDMKVAAVLSLCAVLITQPSVAMIIFIMIVVYIGVSKKQIITISALVLALLLFWLPMIFIYGSSNVLDQMGINVGFVSDKTSDTSGGVTYGVGDFIDVPFSTRIDQPTGLGLVVTILAILGVVSLGSSKDWFNVVLILWLIFCLLGVEGNALPFKMMPHRFWVFLALPVVILAGIGAVKVLGWLESSNNNSIFKLILIILLIMSAAYPKIMVETSTWFAGQFEVSNGMDKLFV